MFTVSSATTFCRNSDFYGGVLGPIISDVRDYHFNNFRFHHCVYVQNPLKSRYKSVFRHENRKGKYFGQNFQFSPSSKKNMPISSLFFLINTSINLHGAENFSISNTKLHEKSCKWSLFWLKFCIKVEIDN